MATFRDDQIFLSRVAEQAGRFEDMAESVAHLVTVGQELTFDERCLFSLAFRNVVGTRRAAWRALATLEHQEAAAGGLRASKTESIRSYRSAIEGEIRAYSTRVIRMVDDVILPAITNLENRVYFYKLKGDYNRYLSEISQGNDHKEFIELTHECYRLASDIALQELPPTHPTRLGLALNFSVFYYEILNSPERQCGDLQELTNQAQKQMRSHTHASAM